MSTAHTMPTERGVFDPPAELASLRYSAPIAPLTWPDSGKGWLVTDYELGRAALASPHLSMEASAFGGATREVVDLPAPARRAFQLLREQGDPLVTADQAGTFFLMDPPRHTRFRRLLAADFGPRGVRQLQPQIEAIVDRHVETLAEAGSPSDLVPRIARPIPRDVMRLFLGMPCDDGYGVWLHLQEMIESKDSRPADIVDATRAWNGLVRRIVRAKTLQPDDGLISRLVRSGDLTNDEIVGITKLLYTAGNDTTSSMFGLGALVLLQDRTRWSRLAADLTLLPQAIEELLRYLTILQLGVLPRIATADFEIGDIVVHAGDRVCVSLPAANRDHAVFPHPDTFDLDRDPTGHLAFSFGVHQCLGHHLARSELRAGFAALIGRFPGLRLTADVTELPVKPGHHRIYGVDRVPVAWGSQPP